MWIKAVDTGPAELAGMMCSACRGPSRWCSANWWIASPSSARNANVLIGAAATVRMLTLAGAAGGWIGSLLRISSISLARC